MAGAGRLRRVVSVSLDPGAEAGGRGSNGPCDLTGNLRLRSGLESVLNAVARAFVVPSSICWNYECLNRERIVG